jgi:hypothetical protein
VTPVTITATISLSNETILALAAEHIWHFDEQLDQPRGVDYRETRYYLALWREIRTNVTRGIELGTEHLQELHDAVTSREYDALLSSEELLAVLGSAAQSTHLAHAQAGVFGFAQTAEGADQ